MRLADLQDLTVGIWGSGRECASVVRAIARFGVEATVRIFDEHPQPDATVEGIPVEMFTTFALDECDVIVRSPGISRYRPELNGRRITTATNLWMGEQHRKIIAVTGTKGKSTTASLTAHLLTALGYETRLAGNIGHSPLDQLGESEPEYWVLELSSFQASDLDGRVDVAALTSFSEEHLDWHLTPENYREDKLRLLHHADVAVVNGQNARARELGSLLPNVVFSRVSDFANAPSALFGKHNQELVSIAVSLLSAVGIDIDAHHDAICEAIGTFQPLPHRLEPVGEVDGVLWINDSLSTTATSTMAAIAAFEGRPTTVLLGGHDRGISYELLRQSFVDRPEVVAVLMPQCGERIAESLPEDAHIERSGGLEEAVAIARRVTPKGGVVLLSPAAASFGAFRDYAERGQRFRDLVQAMTT